MPFLKIQNHELEVRVKQAKLAQNIIGDSKLSFSGNPLSTRRAIKNTWEFTTSLLVDTSWKFLRSLLNGEGHVWDFNSSTDWKYSSKGLPITSGTVSNGSRYTTTTKFGAGALRVASGSYVQMDVGYSYGRTVMLWYGSTFANHYIVNSAGQKWVDGVRNDAASTPFISFSSGNLRIGDSGSGSFQYFDDIVVIPEDIDADWAEDFGTMTSAFMRLPYVRVSGDFIMGGTYLAQAFDVKTEIDQGHVSGTWENNLAEVSATLIESSRES